MPPTPGTKVISFANNREATAIFPTLGATPQALLAALNVPKPNGAMLVIGGADSLEEKLLMRLTQLFGRGIARAAADLNLLIIDGGTEAGVMKLMGQGVADRGFKSTLIGVAPAELVSYPGSEKKDQTPLDPNHSHFILVAGKEWGSETGVLFKLIGGLSDTIPKIVLVAGGGDITKRECLQAIRQNFPLIIIEGTGGAADEIATAWKAKPDLPDDPLLAEIVADGCIEFHRLGNSIKAAERLLVRALGGDNVLSQAWERYAEYDENANRQQSRFNWIQGSIIFVGLIATALALFKQVVGPKDADGNDAIARYSLWWFIHYLLILIPIMLSILITAVSRFKQGNKWLLLRAGAESLKREIFRYRARAGDYRELPVAPPVDPTAPSPPPRPTPDQVLAQRIEDVTRRTMRTEVNTSAIAQRDKTKAFPPGLEKGDDGYSTLTPDRYLQVRLSNQLNYYKKNALKLERKLRVLQWAIFIIGGLGTLLAAINKQVWIALTTAVCAALATYLGYKQTEATLMKYNQSWTDLDNCRAWWIALPAEEQAKPENVDSLVDHAEKVLQSELDGWVQQMQNALAELRKGQASAPEKEEPGAGGSPETPATEGGAGAVPPGAEPAPDAATEKVDPADVVDEGTEVVPETEYAAETGEATPEESQVPATEEPVAPEPDYETHPGSEGGGDEPPAKPD